MTKPMTCREIAHAIDQHLKMFEADPTINVHREFVDGEWRLAAPGKGTPQFYFAFARASGRFIRVAYVEYQGVRSLTKAEAETYLAWLKAGNVGTHHKATMGMKP